MDKEGFARRFRLAVSHAKVEDTQDALGKLLGVSSVMIWSYKTGEKLPRMATAIRISEKLGVNVNWLLTGTGTMTNSIIEPVGSPRSTVRLVPIKATAHLVGNGYYEELEGSGCVDSYSTDPKAYGIRVKGDCMHPAIRNGAIVIVEPNGVCIPTEYVAITLQNGDKMIKELVVQREFNVVVESVNGNLRQTIERAEILQMHPVAAVVAASKWRSA